MIIRDLNVERVTAAPLKTDSPLVINSDAILFSQSSIIILRGSLSPSEKKR